ncbi:MAG: hypothetical protein KF767_13105 [Bdellovibrionaceae bacterium]|nr:hypothetical protein [Pseudobdellovibrionaceae bacterium]
MIAGIGWWVVTPAPSRLAHFEDRVAASLRHPAFDREREASPDTLVPLPEQWRARDPMRPNLCLITINSADEGEIFREKLKSQFNIFELAAGAPTGFLRRACQAGIECDILLVSGHFAGSFFGTSAFRLGTNELELASCDAGCRGLFQKPKEVFLFGCNTLATKRPDHRTAGEYADLLVSHYQFSRAQAEEVAAFRYSPIGGEFAGRMRTIFPRSRLYGYSGVGPTGPQVRTRLQKYVDGLEDYGAYFHAFDPLNGEPNKALRKLLKGTVFTETRGAGEKAESPVCVLNDKRRTLSDRLAWINAVFRDENSRLQYLPVIDSWLEKLEENFGRGLPDAEQGVLDRLQHDANAKKSVLSQIARPVPGLISTQLDILNFARRVGWVGGDDYHVHGRRLLGKSLKYNLDRAEADIICAWDGRFDLAPDQLPPRPWTEPTLKALRCLGVQNAETLKLVAQDLARPELAGLAAEIIGRSRSEDPAVVGPLLALLDSSDTVAPIHALHFIQRRGTTDRALILKIAEMAGRLRSIAGAKAVETLTTLQAFDSEIQNRLLKLLEERPFPAVASAIRDYLIATRTPNPEVHRTLAALIERSADPRVAGYMVQALGELKPQDVSIQLLLAEGASEIANDETRALFIVALRKIRPQNAEVQRRIANGLDHESARARREIYQLLQELAPTDPRLRFRLWRVNPESP